MRTRNAGNLFTGYFEEISPAQMRQQFETNLFGPMNVRDALSAVDDERSDRGDDEVVHRRLRPAHRPWIEGMKSMNGKQPGDPAKLARALLTIAGQDKPLHRFVAGADAIEAAEAKAKTSSHLVSRR
ncbi:hypothetical protein ACFY1B_51945 [Streptomyces mirabilis]|uniref:hypothetical protein n=1 Tax=Streptomyces mirabilis TaxID=68239 RepID=UPI0036C0F642